MARKDVLKHLVADSQSLADDFTTPATFVQYLDNISYQINVDTSDSEGTFVVQASDDYAVDALGQVQNAGNWVDLTLGGGTPTVDAEDDTIMIGLSQVPFVALRIKYNSETSGTGTCDIWLNARQIGG